MSSTPVAKQPRVHPFLPHSWSQRGVRRVITAHITAWETAQIKVQGWVLRLGADGCKVCYDWLQCSEYRPHGICCIDTHYNYHTRKTIISALEPSTDFFSFSFLIASTYLDSLLVIFSPSQGYGDFGPGCKPSLWPKLIMSSDQVWPNLTGNSETEVVLKWSHSLAVIWQVSLNSVWV